MVMSKVTVEGTSAKLHGGVDGNLCRHKTAVQGEVQRHILCFPDGISAHASIRCFVSCFSI